MPWSSSPGQNLAKLKPILIEACCGSVEEAVAAYHAGADRIELCAGLPTGGVTPSIGMVEEARALVPIPIVAMIRPREGRANPADEEKRAALRDVKHLIRAGADQLILGWLTDSNQVDKDGMRSMLDEAGDTPCAFHRVIDMCPDLHQAVDDLIELGFCRVLTSGGAENVDLGMDNLRLMQEWAGDRMTILAGGGVRESNAAALVQSAGMREIHFSFREASGLVGYGGVEDTKPLPDRIIRIRQLLEDLAD